MELLEIILIIAAFVLGGGIAIGLVFFIQNLRAKSIIQTAKAEGEAIKKAKLLEVKEKYLQLKNEYEKQASVRNSKLQSTEARLVQKEKQLLSQEESIVKKESEIEHLKTS